MGKMKKKRNKNISEEGNLCLISFPTHSVIYTNDEIINLKIAERNFQVFSL